MRMTRLLLSIGLVGPLLLTACATPATATNDAAEAPAATETPAPSDTNSAPLYVCNQGAAAVTVIDMATQEVVDTVDLQALGFSANAKPHHAVAEPDGSHWYVTLIGENRVLKFNRANELVGQAEMEVPGLLSLHPTDDWLLVGRSMSAVDPPQSIVVIDRSAMTVQQEIDTFFPRPHALATAPNGAHAYVASLAENQLMALGLEEPQTMNLTRLGGPTHTFVQFAISPDGSTMVGTGQVSNQLLVFDLSEATAPVVTDTIDVNAEPWHPVFSPDGQHVYFGNKTDHTVTVVDMETRAVDAVIEGEGLAQPHGTALSPDGQYLYVSNNNRQGTFAPESASSAGTSADDPPGTVTIINTETREIEKVISVGAYASGVGTPAKW